MPLGLLGLRNYVSWTAGDQEGTALTGFRAYAKTYEEDFIKCKGPSQKSAEVKGLDVDAMFTEWNSIRTKQKASWKILGKNCACVVIRVLRAGGCDQYVRSYMKRNPAIITPQAVWEYTKAADSTRGTIRHQDQLTSDHKGSVGVSGNLSSSGRLARRHLNPAGARKTNCRARRVNRRLRERPKVD